MSEIKVSLIASSNRPDLYEDFFRSLIGTSVSYEVIFVGNKVPSMEIMANCKHLKYIETRDIKPAQCYEIARRDAIGEVIIWVADDCEFPNDVIGRAYKHYKTLDEKTILSIQTKESGYGLREGKLFPMAMHRLHAGNLATPLMAPLGLISRKFLEDLGGFDRRFVCGQYENKVVLMANERGGWVQVFGGDDCFIDIDHLGKSLKIGESKNEEDFLERPFATGYSTDREVLFLKDFEPYQSEKILTESQSNKGMWQ